jgi:hypothetical protein
MDVIRRGALERPLGYPGLDPGRPDDDAGQAHPGCDVEDGDRVAAEPVAPARLMQRQEPRPDVRPVRWKFWPVESGRPEPGLAFDAFQMVPLGGACNAAEFESDGRDPGRAAGAPGPKLGKSRRHG